MDNIFDTLEEDLERLLEENGLIIVNNEIFSKNKIILEHSNLTCNNFNMKVTMPQGREFTVQIFDLGFKLTDEDGFVLYPKDLELSDRKYVERFIQLNSKVLKHV